VCVRAVPFRVICVAISAFSALRPKVVNHSVKLSWICFYSGYIRIIFLVILFCVWFISLASVHSTGREHSQARCSDFIWGFSIVNSGFENLEVWVGGPHNENNQGAASSISKCYQLDKENKGNYVHAAWFCDLCEHLRCQRGVCTWV
jgi:hypothetical protein